MVRALFDVYFPKTLILRQPDMVTPLATFLAGSYQAAIPKIDGLIKQFPKFAFLHEMKGEILLRSGRAKAAIRPFQLAYKYDRHKSGMIRIELAHAMLETGDRSLINKAIKELKAGISRDPNTGTGLSVACPGLWHDRTE